MTINPTSPDNSASAVEKYEDLENEICEVRNMADIASSFVEDKMSGLHRRAMIGDQQYVTVTVREADLIVFSVYQVERLAKELQAKFYAIGKASK
jgi:hypothetical protein